MKQYVRAALAVLFLFLAANSCSAQTPTYDAINFKGVTNIFNIKHSTGAPASSCTGTAQYVQDDDTTGNPFWVCKNGTMVHFAGIPTFTANQGVAANGSGTLSTTPEKGFSTAGGVTSVAWDEDQLNGRFDCRNPAYAGGCLGTTPQLAMQSFANALICYQSMTGKHATTYFPNATILVGTPSQPTLILPAGGNYYGANGPSGSAGTTFQGTYNNVRVLQFNTGQSATCSDSHVHTSNLTDGNYIGFGVSGCTFVSCVNVPGDSNSYPNGGPLNNGMYIGDSQGWVDRVSSGGTGGDGVEVGGLDTHVGQVYATAHNYWLMFGKNVAGQTYNPATDGLHGGVILSSGDGQFIGPFETYGTFNTPGNEYGHLAGVVWSGGNTVLGPIFTQLEEIGELVGAASSGRQYGGRIDAPEGEGIVATGGANHFMGMQIVNACTAKNVAWESVASVAIATAGSGQTPGTYTLTASGGQTTNPTNMPTLPTPTAATIQVVVSAGGTVTATPTVTNAGTEYISAPIFTLAAGGTPATFTVTMNAALIVASRSGAQTGHCAYFDDGAITGDSFSGIHMGANTAVFGNTYASADFIGGGYLDATNQGNGLGSNSLAVIVQSFVNSTPLGQGLHLVLPDFPGAHGAISFTGSTLDVLAGNHFSSNNSTPTSVTTVKNARVGQDIWLLGGDGNTTLPVANNWATCNNQDLNLAKGQWYHFIYSFLNSGQGGFIEQCDLPDFTNVFVDEQALASPPAAGTTGTLDVAGGIVRRAIPQMGDGNVGQVGAGSGDTQTYATECYIGGGVMYTNPLSINATPPGVTDPSHQIQYNAFCPTGTTRYRQFRNSTTTAGLTAGVVVDQTAPAVPGYFLITQQLKYLDTFGAPILSTDTVATAQQGKNSTGMDTIDRTNIPASSSAPGLPGQIVDDPVGGFRYFCTANNTWKHAPLTYATF